MNDEIVTIRSTILTPTECAIIAATPKDSAKKAEARYENFKVAIHPDFPDQEITIGGTVSTKARTELCTLLKGNLDIFAWQPSRTLREITIDLPDFDSIIREGYPPVRQKNGQALAARQGNPSKVKGWLDEDLEYYHLKELHYSAQCHTQMSLWIISRGVVLLILLMEYKFQVWYIELTSPSDHNNSRKNTRLSKQNLQSSSMTFIHKTLIIPSVLDSCFISSTVCEVKRVMILLYIKICAYDKKFSSRWTYTTMMLPRVRNHHGGKCVHLGLN
ncbi:hypothetical protein Tco_1202876 [Tanacetum coccineum]